MDRASERETQQPGMEREAATNGDGERGSGGRRRERERCRDRHSDRQTDRQTDRQRQRYRERTSDRGLAAILAQDSSCPIPSCMISIPARHGVLLVACLILGVAAGVPRDISNLHPSLVQFLAPALAWIEKEEKENPILRWRHCVELFAGAHEISTAVQGQGLNAIAYDLKYTPCSDWNNIIKNEGFHRAMRLVLEVRPFGTAWAAPVCGPWVFICRHGTGRTVFQPEGDRDVKRVRMSNLMVIHVVIILLVAWYRNLTIFTEQPQGSLMSEFSPMREFISSCMPYSCHTFLGAFGASTPKPVVIRSSTQHIAGLARKRPRDLETLAETKDGKVNGKSSQLKQSAAYPKAFGEAVATIVKKVFEDPSLTEVFWSDAASILAEQVSEEKEKKKKGKKVHKKPSAMRP